MYLFIFLVILCNNASGYGIQEVDLNFRVDAGTRTCLFEKGKYGQRMEMYYEVINGQHGELDISVDILDPSGENIVSYFKNSQNSIIFDVEQDGDYALCMDNTYSLINSKLVFIYIVIEDETKASVQTPAELQKNDGQIHENVEIIEWEGLTDDGELYTIDVGVIVDSLTVTMNRIVKARHILSLFKTAKRRDSYLAQEDTFIVDVWSSFQIVFMATVGLIQVYTIKKLFTKPSYYSK